MISNRQNFRSGSLILPVRYRSATRHSDAEFTPTYTQEEFAELLDLIPVEKYDNRHDLWLELLLACTHASTVKDGKEAFMEWTTRGGPGDRVGYAADYDKIVARWDSNFAKRNMNGNAVKVGTFNKHLVEAGYGDKVKYPWDTTAEEDFERGCRRFRREMRRRRTERPSAKSLRLSWKLVSCRASHAK